MIFITQGRYTHQAVTGMLAKPEDRSAAVAKLAEAAGGKMLGYYVTYGEYDFLVIIDGPADLASMGSALIVAAAGGGVSDLKTTVAMTGADAVSAFEKAGSMAAAFRSAGQS